MFRAAHFGRPKNFHVIARLRPGEVIEVMSETEFVEEPRGAGPIGVPATPDAFAIALMANHEAFERRIIEIERAARAQRLDCFHEDQISRARAIAGRRRVWLDEKFA